ncbi:hypothetical protein BHE90_002773 [Fusarium euwallaceae]|uniref:Sister chromatid cohesion protein DCC1 n=5 Tax=Fusarium solani species complex TaxID=232080 RepID=A0A3M2SN36_9HYPO|nr:hypothetical protein CDV36_001599 [Fusarium kuroshium]RSL66886.1 hypothetical protein CEP51_012723 [Fusarium floridanum]RSM05512.1 hypothetical protein CEP52_006267 [Fusarium oligoseptatum]RSM19386.1 hypothetical protein CDV31_001808 [Fusarium ambrosium]RTE82652.1 hypothetical protein BHE90_002773 [Fusarium euwallaceae]
MSSQSRGITVQHTPSETNYRLIELPPELQSLLESDSAPVLTLESSDTSALLKTPSKTYALRQKNTSNAFMLLSPTPSTPENPEQGISIVSTIRETVELEVVPDKTAGTSSGTTKSLGGAKGKWHERFGRNR